MLPVFHLKNRKKKLKMPPNRQSLSSIKAIASLLVFLTSKSVDMGHKKLEQEISND